MNPLEYENIVTYKLKGLYPSSFTKTEKFVLRRKASVYDIEGEELCYWRHKGTTKAIKTKVVCGSEEANRIFNDFHASAVGAHCGQMKTRDAISKRFYWPGMSVDIRKWVSQCLACQASTPSMKKSSALTPIKVSEPFELVGMDLIGKLTPTTKGHQYICVMVDYFTKWPQAYAIKSKCAEEVTECLLKYVYQFGAPKRIRTDQGREFVNSINKEVCSTLGIKRSLCSPYHPQTNGLVERMNGTIQRALSKVVANNSKDWDDYLDPVMFGLRTKKQITTKYSPYYLMFGREARYPSEIPEEVQIDSSVEDAVAVEQVSQDSEVQTKLFESVRQHLAKGYENTKRKIKPENFGFKIGDKVWRQNVRSQQRKGGKLDANYLGPYIIKAIEGKSADLQDDKGAIFHKINIDHLKLTIDSTPRVPHTCLATIPAPVTRSPSAPDLTSPPQPSASEKYVRDAWAGNTAHVLLSKIGAYKLFYWDIHQLGPNMDLESECINAYLSILVREHNCRNMDKAAFLDTYAMTSMWQGKPQRLKIKPMDYHVLLGIINEHHHWKLAAIYPHENRALLLDPLGESKQEIQKCLVTTRAFMRKRGCNVSRWTCETVKHPIQGDSTSCGVFALKFAEKVLKKDTVDFNSTPMAINDHRMEIALKLLLQTDDLEELCSYCGEEEHETDCNWIQCDVCLRGFHELCMGNPPSKQPFVCPACV